jgi:glycosyltransferase involved in cell wall biosynthesis
LQVRAAKSGVGQYIAGLIDGLLGLPEWQERGHRLTVFATPENAANYQREAGSYRVKVWGTPGARMPSRRLREWLLLPGEIRREGIDVWHGPSNFLPLWKVGRCAYVVTLHDVSYWIQPQRVTLAKRLYWKAWTARTVQVADRFITASNHALKTITQTLRIPPGQFDLIPHAPHAHFRPQPELHAAADAWWNGGAETAAPVHPVLAEHGLRPGRYVLCVSTLEPGKNLKALVDAWAQLRRENANNPLFDGLKLVLTGDRGWLLDPLMKAIYDSALADDVVLTGHLPDASLPVLMNQCGVFGFLSFNEGFGLPPLEALACGAPVVASNTSSLPEVLGDAALLVAPDDKAGIVNQLFQSLMNLPLRAHLRDAGPQRAIEFSWQKTARLTLDTYEKTCMMNR